MSPGLIKQQAVNSETFPSLDVTVRCDTITLILLFFGTSISCGDCTLTSLAGTRLNLLPLAIFSVAF